MPSGSHGGGGGFGGHGGFTGSSFSSSGSRSSSSASRSFRPRGPRYFHFGHRTLIISTGRQSILSLFAFLMVFAVMMLISVGSTKSAYKEELSMIEEEYRYYQNMITYAEANKEEGYVITAKVASNQYAQDLGKYRIFYTFKTETGKNVNGYTFYVYSLEDLKNLPVNKEFELAVDSVPVTESTDSIPVDYKYTILEDDAAYVVLKEKIKSISTYTTIGWVAVAVLLVGSVLVVFTAKKKKEEKEEADRQKEIENEIAEEKKKFCQYCGTKILEGDQTCPNCGSRLDR